MKSVEILIHQVQVNFSNYIRGDIKDIAVDNLITIPKIGEWFDGIGLLRCAGELEIAESLDECESGVLYVRALWHDFGIGNMHYITICLAFTDDDEGFYKTFFET
jgi:hypothetical protein